MDASKSFHWSFFRFWFHKECKILYLKLYHHSTSFSQPFWWKFHVLGCIFMLINVRYIDHESILSNREALFHDLTDIVLDLISQVHQFLCWFLLHDFWIKGLFIVVYKIFYPSTKLFKVATNTLDKVYSTISLLLICI